MTRKQRWESTLLIAGIPIAAALFGWCTEKVQFSETFYVTVAQVIPVFLLAAAVE